MDSGISLPYKHECSVNIDNLTFRMVVDAYHGSYDDSELSRMVEKNLHTHSFAELFCCNSGQIELNTEFGEIRLEGGDIAVIPAGVRHVKSPGGMDGVWRSIGFICVKLKVKTSEGLYACFSGVCYGARPVVFHDKPDICADIRLITDTIQDRVSYLHAIRMAGVLAGLIESEQVKQRAVDDKMRDIDLYRISQLEHMLESSFMKDLRAKDMARMLYISERQLERLMKCRYGMTWHRAVIEKRLTCASRMLLESNQPADMIGLSVGFNSKSSFYREFRKRYRCAPIRYRRNFREDGE